MKFKDLVPYLKTDVLIRKFDFDNYNFVDDIFNWQALNSQGKQELLYEKLLEQYGDDEIVKIELDTSSCSLIIYIR